MTIKIITGSIMGFDTFHELYKLQQQGFFNQWYRFAHPKKNTITVDDGVTYWGRIVCKTISSMENSALVAGRGIPRPREFFRIINTTGSGKTLLATIWLFYAWKNKQKIAANMNIKFADKMINNYEDFLALEGYQILLDDIRHIITSWNSKDAKISSEFANSSRKKGNGINITTQRLENFVPPDIRMITDEIHVPFIMWFDGEKKAPDWTPTNPRYMPLKIADLRFSAGLEFLDYKVYNLMGESGKFILDSFNTMQISESFNNPPDLVTTKNRFPAVGRVSDRSNR